MLQSVGFKIGQQRVLSQFNSTYDEDSYSYQLMKGIASFVPGDLGSVRTKQSLG